MRLPSWRLPAPLALGLVLPLLAPAAALAGGHGPVAPAIVRPAMSAAPGAGPKVIQLAPKPVYGPPSRAIYGPPRGQRHAYRHRGQGGFAGFPAVYQPVLEGSSAHAQAAPSGEYLRPRAHVVTVYNGPPPLWQGDAGYVAQPVIYNVETVLRRYPLTGMEPHVGK